MLNISKTKERSQVSIRNLLVVTAITAVLIAGRRYALQLTPKVREYRRMAASHARSASEWSEYTRLSERGITSIHKNSQGRSVLTFNHFFPTERPASPEAAEAFDRRCAEIAAVCRARASYHTNMGKKWQRAASHPWVNVLPDPPPPMPLDADDMRDIAL